MKKMNHISQIPSYNHPNLNNIRIHYPVDLIFPSMYNFHTELIYRAVLFFVSNRICTLRNQIPVIGDSVDFKVKTKYQRQQNGNLRILLVRRLVTLSVTFA